MKWWGYVGEMGFYGKLWLKRRKRVERERERGFVKRRNRISSQPLTINQRFRRGCGFIVIGKTLLKRKE
jgi:hypothetical protein